MKTGTRYIRRIIVSVMMAALYLSGSAQESFRDSVVLSEREVGDSVVLREVEVFHKTALGNASSQVISREMIEALPSSNVADALKHFAGVQIKDYGGLGGQKTVNVRSLGSQHVGVYIDGVRVTNVQNGTVDLGKYSLSTLESVSLYNANKTEPLMMASEYASASTVYLQTRRPEKTSFSALGSVGSFGTYKGETTASYKNFFLINTAFTKSNGNYPFAYHTEYEDTTGTRQNSDIRMVRVEGSAFWKDFQLHTYHFDSERGIPGGIVRRLSDHYTDVGREWDRNFFSQVSYKKKFPLSSFKYNKERAYNKEHGEIGVRGILKYANDFLHYRSDYPENISVHANNKYRQQDVYGAIAINLTPALSHGRGSLKDRCFSLSSDIRWSDLMTDVKNFRYVYRLDSKTSLAAFYNFKGIDINVGGLYSHIMDYSDGKEKTMERFTYNINASYSPSLFGEERALSLRAFYKEVFRAPTLNDLYYTLVGNRNLRPEYTRQFDIGTTFSLPLPHGGGLGWGLDFYFNKIKDRIVALPLKGAYQWTMLNYGETRCLGVDVSGNVRYKSHSLLLTATFQDDRNRTSKNADSYNDFIAYSPRWSATAVYSFHYKKFSASLSHIFVDKRYWTTENAIEPPLDAYNCTDMKLGYKFQKISIETNFNNIFNQHYEIIQRWPMPKRQFTFTVRYTPCSL